MKIYILDPIFRDLNLIKKKKMLQHIGALRKSMSRISYIKGKTGNTSNNEGYHLWDTVPYSVTYLMLVLIFKYR
jgi:hypothetical protein